MKTGLEWRAVIDGKYIVSENGDVRLNSPNSKNLKWRWAGRNMAYAQMCYTDCAVKKKKYRYIHDLVASAFLGEKPLGLCTNHKNGIKSDNHYSNLEYCSYKENTHHAMRIGTFFNPNRKPASKLSEYEVRLIRKGLGLGFSYNILSRMFRISRGNIQAIKENRTWKHV